MTKNLGDLDLPGWSRGFPDPDEGRAISEATLLAALREEHRAVHAFIVGGLLAHPPNQQHAQRDALIAAHDKVADLLSDEEDA